MNDESFKYTLHHPDGTKEQKVGNNFDVYLTLRDFIEKEIFRLDRQIDKTNSMIKAMAVTCICTSIGVITLGAAFIIRAFK